MQALLTEKIPAQACTTRFPAFVAFCTVYFFHEVLYCSGQFNSLDSDSALFLSWTRSSRGSLGTLHIILVHPGCDMFTSSGAPQSMLSIAYENDDHFRQK